MTCTSGYDLCQYAKQVPISFTQWKTVLEELAIKDQPKLFSTPDRHRPTLLSIKKSEHANLGRNQVFNDGVVDSFLISSTLSLSRQDLPKIVAPSSKRYVSSFKTLVNLPANKQTQRLNYINDSVVIFRLSKEHANESSLLANSQYSSKHSNLSTGTASSTGSSKQQQQQQPPPPPSPIRLSPLLKIEGQKHRIAHHDLPIIVPSTVDISLPSNSTHPMATSTSSQLQTNSSVFTYRSAAAGGNPVRQRAIAETTPNSLLISAERFKSNMPTTLRQTRQPLTTTLSPAYLSSQPPQRNVKSRIQQEKTTNSREMYDYPDPFTNCPQDVLNKLSQLTKLQLETIDWEKKKRFTKKKPLTNGTVQGKDSP